MWDTLNYAGKKIAQFPGRVQQRVSTTASGYDATTYATVANDAYPLSITSTFQENELPADDLERRGKISVKAIGQISVEIDGDGNKQLVSSNSDTQDLNQYLPRFLNDVYADIRANGSFAQIFHAKNTAEGAKTLEVISFAARSENPFYAAKAKLILNEALTSQRRILKMPGTRAADKEELTTLLTANNDLERLNAVTGFLNKSIDSLDFRKDALDETLPKEIERSAKVFHEPMRSLIKAELQGVVDDLMARPRDYIEDPAVPLAVKSAALQFIRRSVESAYPGTVKDDPFAQKVLDLLEAEPGSEVLENAQAALRDEILGDVDKLVDFDIEFERHQKFLTQVSDSVAHGTEIFIDGEYRVATQAELDAATKRDQELFEEREEVLKNSLESSVRLKKTFEKLTLTAADGTKKRGIQDLFWSRLLDTNGDIEKSWIAKLVASEDDVAELSKITYESSADIDPSEYEGVAKKLAQLIKDAQEQASQRLANEELKLEKLEEARDNLDQSFIDRFGFDYHEAAFDPAKVADIRDAAQALKASEGNEAAAKLLSSTGSFDPQVKLDEVLSEVSMDALSEDDKLILTNARALIETPDAELGTILAKLHTVDQEAIQSYIKDANDHLLSIRLNYTDMISASMQKAQGKGYKLDAHLSGLSLPAPVAAGTSIDDLEKLSDAITNIDNDVRSTQAAIVELKETKLSKAEFEKLRDDAIKSLKQRTQKMAFALIDNLEPSKENLESLQAQVKAEAKNYFIAREKGDKSPIVKMLAELFQDILDKIGIKLGE